MWGASAMPLAVLLQKCRWAFLSYRISQLLPKFPSRNIFIGFISLQPTLEGGKNQNKQTKKPSTQKTKPRIFCCFYFLFIAVVVIVQLFISFGGMQSVHVLKNFMCLSSTMSSQAGCSPFQTGIIRVTQAWLEETFRSMYFVERISPLAQVHRWL